MDDLFDTFTQQRRLRLVPRGGSAAPKRRSAGRALAEALGGEAGESGEEAKPRQRWFDLDHAIAAGAGRSGESLGEELSFEPGPLEREENAEDSDW